MKNIIFLGSPKKNGISAQIASRILQDIPDAELVYAYDLRIKGCNGCEICRELKRCVFSDDMDMVYAKIKAAQNIIIVSPIYFLGFPGPLKCMIDRTQVFWNHPLFQSKNALVLLHGESANKSLEPFYQKTCFTILKNWGVKNMQFQFFGMIKNFSDLNSELLETHISWLKDKQ